MFSLPNREDTIEEQISRLSPSGWKYLVNCIVAYSLADITGRKSLPYDLPSFVILSTFTAPFPSRLRNMPCIEDAGHVLGTP